MMKRTLTLFFAFALAAAACGDSGTTTTVTEPPPAPASTTTTEPLPPTTTTTTEPPAPTTTTTTEPPPTTTTTTTTSTTEPPPTTTTLPGDPFDFFFQAGDVLGVVGVAFDDVLNVRDVPAGSIVGTLDPLADDVVAVGNARLLPTSLWVEVTGGGATGWASSRFLAYLGLVTDDTSIVVNGLGGIPAAETMLDLGLLVAEFFASEEPPSDIVVSVAPTVADLGEVTYDVVGLGDDALAGLRLHVFGTPDEGGEGFSLRSVEVTALCGRGVTPDGLCV